MVASERRFSKELWVVVGILLTVVMLTQIPRQPGGWWRATGEDSGVTAVLGSSRRNVSDSQFRGTKVTAVAGHSRLDLRQMIATPGTEVVVEVLAVTGSVTIRVPPGWIVDAVALPVVGDLRDQRIPDERAEGETAVNAPRLVLHGAVVVGVVRITS